MPPIFLHMAVARDVAAELPPAPLAAEKGTYLLGATSPDIRVIARWERERTHFFNLSDFEHQDSVAKFFAAYPSLAAPERLKPETIAFVSGYITHLALDETWIVKVYRPYFGQLSALGGDLSANTMDRLLQFELDRRRRDEPNA
ncbi:MAG TPA: zinc dependent phospholipase C family protein, partial [Bryobacteraceae bacterium]|nr:zinc dependent phospholipase C family protein [Bryobacteraceae bacterium]